MEKRNARQPHKAPDPGHSGVYLTYCIICIDTQLGGNISHTAAAIAGPMKDHTDNSAPSLAMSGMAYSSCFKFSLASSTVRTNR